MKKNEKHKEYVVVMEDYHALLGGTKFLSNRVEEMFEKEIKDYVRENGTKNIKYIFKNEPIEIETIVNLKEGN